MKRVLACVLWGVLAWGPERSEAASPADQLLPATTQAMVSIPDLADLQQRWAQTQLGHLAADPLMKPFAEDVQRQVQEKLVAKNLHLRIDWAALTEACGGELAIASIQPGGDPKQHAAVLLVDITGRREAAQKVLENAGKQLAERGATRRTETHGALEWIIHELPRQKGETTSDLVIRFETQDQLVVTNHAGVAQFIQDRLEGRRQLADTLSGKTSYQEVMTRVQKEAGADVPQVRWYVQPFGYADVLRAAQKGPKKRRKDMLAILRGQGFDALQAVGGWVHIGTTHHELLHRTFVFAPGAAAADENFQLAARMLTLPNESQWSWPTWVPRELATAFQMRWNVGSAFEHASTLVDAIAGDEEFFEDLLTSLKTDPNGPKIDVRKDFVQHLDQHITVVSDHIFPITPQSERLLVAIAVKDDAAVLETVRRTLATDPDARMLEFDGHKVWEIIQPKEGESDSPDVSLSIDGIESLADPPAEEEAHRLPNSAVTVAHGHFMVATHVDFLARVLKSHDENDRLGTSEDVRLVQTHLDRLGADSYCLRYFSRTDEEYRPTYELIRAGRMPESESLLGRMLNRMLGPEEKDALREQKIDGTRLPEFDAVRRYLGPAGCYMRTEQNGWFATGVLLNKQALYLDSSQAPAITAARGDQDLRRD